MKKRRLYVGGLPWAVDDKALKALFEEGDETVEGCGLDTVEEATVVLDRETNRSRGFAFVTMSSLETAEKAVATFNGLEYQKRRLRVDEADDQSMNRGPKREGSRRSSDAPFKKKKY